MIVRALALNNWIRIADFMGVVLGSAPQPKSYSDEPEEPFVSVTPPIKQLNDILRSNTSITELRLQILEFTAAEFRELVEALKCNAAITKLVLQHGRRGVSDGVGEALVDLLRQFDDAGHRRHASVIESVILKRTKGSAADTTNEHGFPSEAFCAALKCNETLTSIDMGEYFQDDAIAVLLDAIEHNPRIVSVAYNADIDEDDEDAVESIERILKARRRVSLAI